MDRINELRQKLVDWCTKKGVPVPILRDPIAQKPSASFTLLVVSSGLVIFGLLNKVAKLVDGVDIDNALQFFGICAGLYFGRKLTSDKKEEEK